MKHKMQLVVPASLQIRRIPSSSQYGIALLKEQTLLRPVRVTPRVVRY